MKKSWIKAIKEYRKTCKWYYIEQQSSIHLFGGCPSRLSPKNSHKVLGRNEAHALYRYMKRWDRRADFIDTLPSDT